MRRGSSHKAACFCKATPERGLKAGLDSEKSGYWTASTGLYDGVLRVYCLVTLSLSLLAWVCILKFILFLISLPRGNPYTKSDRRHQFAYDARTYNSRAHTHTPTIAGSLSSSFHFHLSLSSSTIHGPVRSHVILRVVPQHKLHGAVVCVRSIVDFGIFNVHNYARTPRRTIRFLIWRRWQLFTINTFRMTHNMWEQTENIFFYSKW